MDGNGGTDVLPMAPSGIAITSGHDRLACMSLGPNGLLRWYSACCRTPLANTSRNARTPYVGLCTACLAGDEASLSQRFGPRDRVMLNVKSATGDVPPTRLALLKGGLAILAGMLRERLAGRARPPSVFFDAQGQSAAPVDVIPLERRRQLSMPA